MTIITIEDFATALKIDVQQLKDDLAFGEFKVINGDTKEFVLVRNDILKQALSDSTKLNALENGGVDSWEGYNVAMEDLQ